MRSIARLIAFVALTFVAATAEAREIALSFDDAPIEDSPIMAGEVRTQKLIEALKAAGVAQAVFFATPKDHTASDQRRLRALANAGHIIANHSRRHPNLRQMTPESYLADIADADRLLRDLPNFRAWFRFPFLSEGDTKEKRDAVRAGLRRMGYAQGYVTVDNYDFYINNLANDAKQQSNAIDEAALRDLYVETIMQAVEFYDAIAMKALQRSPRHVLLLHENDVAAFFIGDLVAALRKTGWTIISPEDAYKDPIAQVEPDTLFLGQGRVAAIAHTQGVKGRDLVHEREDDVVLDKLFAERVLKQP
jgi:peptidoglycan/xylan/chitin deacetylase (PgdA/CDA1 family)